MYFSSVSFHQPCFLPDSIAPVHQPQMHLAKLRQNFIRFKFFQSATFYLLEKFVWHHTSLNFVHTKKNPFQGALAFFDNASSVLLSLLGTDKNYISTRGRCVCEHFSWDSDPQPRHQGWWCSPPCRCSRGERRRGSLNSSAVVLDIQVLQSLSPLSCRWMK